MLDSIELRAFGWKPCFAQQLSEAEAETLAAARVGAHYGSRVLCITDAGEFSLPTQLTEACGDLAVGDWVLLDAEGQRAVRRLERESLIVRKAAGEKAQSQLIAANVDTLFIVSSCNHDFNLARLERYLALAAEAKIVPVVVLTKADLCDDTATLRKQAFRLMSGLLVETIDARDALQVAQLADWCAAGQTVALVGSSGVGKSTLAMVLGGIPPHAGNSRRRFQGASHDDGSIDLPPRCGWRPDRHTRHARTAIDGL